MQMVTSCEKGMESNLWVTIYSCFQVVMCLLIEPFPGSALNEQAAKILLKNGQDPHQPKTLNVDHTAARNSAQKSNELSLPLTPSATAPFSGLVVLIPILQKAGLAQTYEGKTQCLNSIARHSYIDSFCNLRYLRNHRRTRNDKQKELHYTS